MKFSASARELPKCVYAFSLTPRRKVENFDFFFREAPNNVRSPLSLLVVASKTNNRYIRDIGIPHKYYGIFVVIVRYRNISSTDNTTIGDKFVHD